MNPIVVVFVTAVGSSGLVAACRNHDTKPAAPPASGDPSSTPASASDLASANRAEPPRDAGERFVAHDFESDHAGAPPAGFSFARTGGGLEGTWLVKTDLGAPSGANVLAQTNADETDSRFAIAVAETPILADVDLRVKCKPVSGKIDRACGIVFRYRDASTYYVARANALEGNVRLYYVKEGRRHELASHSGKVTSGAWHDLGAVVRGDHIEIHWDGARVLDQHDATFAGAGRVGVWTKADSVTYFDDLSATAL